MRAGSHTRKLAHGGFAYVLALAGLTLLSLGLAKAGATWSDALQREREDQLVRIGVLYAQAIASYYESSPGSSKQYPPTLESLLFDSRMVGTRRHLRRAYTDPLRPGAPLELIQGADGSIRGVFSPSDRAPFRRTVMHFDRVAEIAPAERYRYWAFLAAPRTQ